MGRFKKRFKGVCWKKRSADSDVEDESEKQKTPNGERPSVKGKKKQQKLAREDKRKKCVIDLDLHMSKAVNAVLDKLDRLDILNLEIINEFVEMLDVDRNNKVVRLVRECEDDLDAPKRFIKSSKYEDDRRVQQVSVGPDLVKDEPSVCESQVGQADNDSQCVRNDMLALHPHEKLTMPNVRPQRDDIVSVIHDFPKEEPACVVDGSENVKNTLAKCSLREVGTPTDDTHVSVVSTCCGPYTPFTRESIYKGNSLTDDKKEGKPTHRLVITPVEMISIKGKAECLVESRNSSNPVLVDNSVQVSETQTSQKEMKSIAVNTEEVDDSTKPDQPLSGLFNPAKMWNMTTFDVYCKRVSVPEPEPLSDGESPYRGLFARHASKSRLCKFNLKIPKVFSYCNIAEPTQNTEAKDLSTKREGEQLSGKVKPDSIPVDFEMAGHLDLGSKPTSDSRPTKVIHKGVFGKQQVKTIHVPQLKMICRKMFFDDILHALNQNKSDVTSYKISGLAMAYINVAHQQLKAGAQQNGRGNIMVMPLKEMCLQLLGIGHHINYSDNTDMELNYKDVCNKEGFRPELSNADMDVVDKHQGVETINIPQLRMICRKMFFDDILHASNIDNSVTDSYKLSGLSMAYIKAAHQRLKAGTHRIREKYMTVMPLRAVCRHLLGIGRLTVKGQFGAVAVSVENMGSQQMKVLNGADADIARQIECPRTVGMELPSVERLISTPIGTMSLRYLMEIYQNSGTFKEIHAQFLCYNLLEGLKFLHRKGIAHKFIFPRRIMFNSNGYPSLMSNAEIVGPKIRPRIEFSSPEQITTGSTSIATDIFQVGLVVYSMVYGRSPFKADTYIETKENLLNENFTPDFESVKMSSHGRYFIKKCLRTDPDSRFNVVKCEKPLENAVKWFNIYKGEDLANQNYDSPFKNLIELKAYMDVMLDHR